MTDKQRCSWAEGSDIYIHYHDTEWGVPVLEDRKQFEFLVLESAQAGLSWITILKKRENYRNAYNNFDPESVAGYNEIDVQRLINNPGIIRNKRKIEASLNNARKFLEIQKEFRSFCRYIWQFTDYKPLVNSWKQETDIPAKTALSEEISRDLKKRGFSFLGPIIIYSHLQAVGIVNDHIESCFRYDELRQMTSQMKIRELLP